MAQRIADLFAERFDADTTASAVYETEEGWAIALYLDEGVDRQAVRDLVAEVAGQAAGRALTFEPVADRDWIAASLAGLAPVEAGRFVVHGRHDRARIPANRVRIEIDAALAFGTGHHGTTRGCLLALNQILKGAQPRRILDIGTGSGVLAIAAAKARRTRVFASDIDGNAVQVARENARMNGVAPLLKIVHAAGVADRRRSRRRYDLIMANILLEPLRHLATPMARLAALRGHVVLSGLLSSQARAALAAYRARGFVLERRLALEGWMTLVMKQR